MGLSQQSKKEITVLGAVIDRSCRIGAYRDDRCVAAHLCVCVHTYRSSLKMELSDVVSLRHRHKKEGETS